MWKSLIKSVTFELWKSFLCSVIVFLCDTTLSVCAFIWGTLWATFKRQGGPIGARWQADHGKRSPSQLPNWCENKRIMRTHNLSKTLEELYLYFMRSTELRFSQRWTSKSRAPSIHARGVERPDKPQDSRGTLAFTWAYARSRNHDHGSAH